jgi:hypothetical protein
MQTVGVNRSPVARWVSRSGRHGCRCWRRARSPDLLAAQRFSGERHHRFALCRINLLPPGNVDVRGPRLVSGKGLPDSTREPGHWFAPVLRSSLTTSVPAASVVRQVYWLSCPHHLAFPISPTRHLHRHFASFLEPRCRTACAPDLNVSHRARCARGINPRGSSRRRQT